MAKASTIDAVAATLTVPERVLLFCLASDTDWAKAGVPSITVQHLLVRNLVKADHAGHLALTDQGGKCWRRCSSRMARLEQRSARRPLRGADDAPLHLTYFFVLFQRRRELIRSSAA